MSKKVVFNVIFITVTIAGAFGYSGSIEMIDPAVGGIGSIISTIALALTNANLPWKKKVE